MANKTVEEGYSLCQKGKTIVKGPTAVGDSHSVSIKLSCPKGTKVIGVHHNHPGGSLHLSEQDKRTAKEKKLRVVCVKAKDKTKCWRFKHKKG